MFPFKSSCKLLKEEKKISEVKLGIYIQTTTQNVIFKFFVQRTHSPLKTSKVEYRKFIRNANPLTIRDVQKTLWLLISKDVILFYPEENKTKLYAKRNDSEQVVYQTKNTLREIQQDPEKTSSKQV